MSQSAKLDPVRVVVSSIAAAYFLWCASSPAQWRMIDGVNLVIHEAGHIVFMPFGQFMTIAGGSLLQIIMPVLFVGHFLRQQQPYSAALVLYWVGQSMLNVSVYAGDSLALKLPLLGGRDTLHDWNWMLSRCNLLWATPKVAFVIRAAATLVILSAAALTFKLSRVEREET